MVRCFYCGRETELHIADIATCPVCSDRLGSSRLKVRSIHSLLSREIIEATGDADAASAAYNQVIYDIPSAIPHPDGVQRIRSVSQRLSIAKKDLARAHFRLNDFLERGTIPEDLK
jgi:hypothetical protein